MSAPEMSTIVAIKAFFESEPNGRKVEMSELKALTADERTDLGNLCREALKS